MAAAELDRLFEAIRRTRDPELLATLFERTAPWLLHRARLLLRRASLAEDVVQDLFLHMLENGHGCEPGRPCLPYLLGMLHRRAARVRRQRARTLAQSLREAAAAADAPIDAAIGAEGRAAVRTAVDALPEPYREVVRRFVAQQSPSAIGRALGRTPNSVRVQLHRGLRLLRSTLPPSLLALLWTGAARPVAAQTSPRGRVLGVAALATVALVPWLGSATARFGPPAAATAAAADLQPAAAAPAAALAGTNAAPVRADVAPAGTGALVLELRHADGSPAAAVGVLAHRAGRDPDFGAVSAVSGADGRVVLRDLPTGPTSVSIDRGVQLDCSVPAATSAPQVVSLPAGVDVSGVVRDPSGLPSEGAGVWLCRDPRCPTEGDVVAHTGPDGRFVLRGVPQAALLGAVRAGSVPSLLHPIDAATCDAELVLGGVGARLTGHVLDRSGGPVAGAVVRVARHPRANFHLANGRELAHVHPCAIVRTDANGAFAAADLPAGPMQVLVRAPRHRTEIGSLALASGTEHRIELRLQPGTELDGEVRDEDGAAIAGARVLARGAVRSAWASVCTAPDGSFALAGLDPGRVLLDVDAPGFVPTSMPVARGARRVAVVLLAEARVVLRLQDATGAAASPGEWDLAACIGGAGRTSAPKPLAPIGDGFVAAGEASAGPFAVRRRGAQVWLRVEPAAGDATLLRIPAAADRVGSLVLSVPGTTPAQRRSLLLVLERDGLVQPIAPADPTADLLEFGGIATGDNRAVLYSRTGLLPAIDLGVVAVPRAPLSVAVPEYGWLRYRLQRSDREPVLQCLAFVTDQRGMQVPLSGADGRVALAAGRYQLLASSLSFPTVGHAFEVASAQETVVDLQLSPGAVRHVAFRLPPEADPQRCRARVRSTADLAGEREAGLPAADRGFDTTADGLCYTTVVLGEGDYLLDVQCGDRAFRSRFGVAGEDGVAHPIEVELCAAR